MPLKDLIEMLGTLNTIKRQQEASALAMQHERTNAFGEFSSLLPHLIGTDQMPQLLAQFSEESGIPIGAFEDIAKHYQPPTADINSNVYNEVLKGTAGTDEGRRLRREVAYSQGTGASAGAAAVSDATAGAFAGLGPEMRRQFDTRVVTGMTSGGLAMDESLKDLPIEKLALGNEIKLGTALSANEREVSSNVRGEISLRGRIAGEEINQADRKLMQDYGLGLLEIQSRGSTTAGAAIEAARRRIHETLQELTTKAMNEAGQRMRLDEMRVDFDSLYGPGAFNRTYPDAYKSGRTLSPGALQRIFFKTGP